MSDFLSLNLAAPIAKAVAAEGYIVPTPIQLQAIPIILSGGDLLGVAQTGTGKTAAFALPILDRIATTPKALKRGSARVLVLAPTRELASQIASSFSVYGKNIRLSVGVAFGGVPINKQTRMLERGLDVLVATPGRLLDLIERGAATLAAVEVLVLDEADQMLDLGFIHALRQIVPMLPKQRQTLLFSATMPASIADLAQRYLSDPAKVSVAPAATTAERVDQRAVYVRAEDKAALLALTLRDPKVSRALIFTRTKHGADRVVKRLDAEKIRSIAIHGNKSQPQRERALDAFRSGACRVLVATDIAARGLDIDNVTHVINYELPNVPEQYVHRIGRTARAGAEGLAISFVANDERAYLRDIEKLTRQRIWVDQLPDGFIAPAAPREVRRPPRGSAGAAPAPRQAPRPATEGKRNHDAYTQRQRQKTRRNGDSHEPAAERNHQPNAQPGGAHENGKKFVKPTRPRRRRSDNAPGSKIEGQRPPRATAGVSGEHANKFGKPRRRKQSTSPRPRAS